MDVGAVSVILFERCGVMMYSIKSFGRFRFDRLVAVGVGLVAGLGLMASFARAQVEALSKSQDSQPVKSTPHRGIGTEADFAELPDKVREALVAGEPEYALRLWSRAHSGEIVNRDLYAQVYRHALDVRLKEASEGAVFDLLLNAPDWLVAERTEGARQLARLWKNDTNSSRATLERRLKWYTKIQSAIRPAPLDPEWPLTLVLLALDHVDHVNNPIENLLLLEIADKISPGNLIWTGYRPDDYYLKRAAEQMVREQKFLAAGEIYRRLIYMTQGDADWFKRQYADNQLNRVYALAGIGGPDFAINAAAQLRLEYLQPAQLGRFRMFKESLRNIITRNDAVRRIPLSIDGSLTLDALPVSYLIENKLIIEKGASLTFGPGSVIRGRGRIILEGGRLNFDGTPDQPIIVIGMTVESDDLAGGGVVTGSNVQFRDCVFRRDPLKQRLPGALRWRITSSYSEGCRFPFDSYVDVEWSRSEFASSEMALPVDESDTQPGNTNAANRLPGAYVEFKQCIFRDTSISDALALRATRSEFVDCQIRWWSPVPIEKKSDVSGSGDGDRTGQRIVENIFIPKGGIPAQINRRSVFASGAGPIVFVENGRAPVLRLGRVKLWVE